MGIFFDEEYLERLAQFILQATEKTNAEIHRLHNEVRQLKEILIMLQPEVQALIDAVAAQGVAIGDATAEITKIEPMLVDLQKQVTDLQSQLGSGQPIDAADLAAIVAVTGTITASIQTIKSVMPAPVDTTSVTAAAAPASDPAVDPAAAAGAA